MVVKSTPRLFMGYVTRNTIGIRPDEGIEKVKVWDMHPILKKYCTPQKKNEISSSLNNI
jgi:hypothetical protein